MRHSAIEYIRHERPERYCPLTAIFGDFLPQARNLRAAQSLNDELVFCLRVGQIHFLDYTVHSLLIPSF